MVQAIVCFDGAPPRAFRDPCRVLIAKTPADVRGVLDEVDRASHAGLYCVGFVTYEAAPAFDRALTVRPRDSAALPCACFALFDAVHPVPAADLVPPAPAAPTPPTAASWSPDVTTTEYHSAVGAIRSGIGRGDAYQVNYTFRLHASGIDAPTLFRRVLRSRPAYAACLDLGDTIIVSASPELFFQRSGTRVVMRPMKGTAPRGRWLEEDDARAAALASSEKERAENLMIVDLVRNDLGRVAQIGSVRATRLCEVDRNPAATVLQMTSTVEANLRPDVGTFELFAALFPCGSVTGAPKIAAMRQIARLERSPRGIYCGAIGYVAPDGDATFSVAIRTATIRGDRAEYGVGGGITWDSSVTAEYDEAISKSRVLVHESPTFELIETMRLAHGRYVRRERHVQRLARSARYFGWTDPTERVTRALDDFARHTAAPMRVRLQVAPNGLHVELAPFPGCALPPIPLASNPVDSANRFLFHKTTLTRRDSLELFWNERRELTEFTIGNLVLEIDGVRYTPTLDAGLLPGVFREELLERGEIVERRLPVEILTRATRVWLINSLREWVPVQDIKAPPDRAAE